MQQATSSQALSPKRDQYFHDQHPLFVTREMQNTTSIMSWKDNVTSEPVYNPTFTFMAPPSSCSSESHFYIDTSLSFTQKDDDFLLNENNMGQRDSSYHSFPQYKYQMSYPSSSSSTITTATPKSRHNSTESLLKDEEERDEEYELMDTSRSKNNTTSSKREKTLEKNRQAASRCRQRKKEWLSQLQTNVERLTRENRILEEQSMSLREEILNLKTILLSHRDCSQSNKPDAIDISKLFYKTQ